MVRTGYGGYSLLLVKTQLWLYFLHPIMIFLDNADFPGYYLASKCYSLSSSSNTFTYCEGRGGDLFNLFIPLLNIQGYTSRINTFSIHSSYQKTKFTPVGGGCAVTLYSIIFSCEAHALLLSYSKQSNYSNWCDLLYTFFISGWLLFIRATLAYIHIKLLVRRGCRRFPHYWGLPIQK